MKRRKHIFGVGSIMKLKKKAVLYAAGMLNNKNLKIFKKRIKNRPEI